MEIELKYKSYRKLTTKDIAGLSECSLRTADRIKREIKFLYNIKIVRYRHYLKYYDEI